MSKKKLFCVTTYSSFRHHYLVDATDAVEAETYVKSILDSDDLVEWQQKHLAEMVADVRPITLSEIRTEHQLRKSEGSYWLPVETVIQRAPRKEKK